MKNKRRPVCRNKDGSINKNIPAYDTKKENRKNTGKTDTSASHRIEHDEEPPAQPLTGAEELDQLPDEDELETPPYEQPPAGEGP